MALYELVANSTTLYLAGTFFLLLVIYDYWNKLYFKRHGIPGPFPLPIIGNFLSMSKGFTTDLVAKKKKYGKVYGLNFTTSTFVVQDLDMLKDIMISQFSTFPNRIPLPFNEKPFTDAVSVITDGHWKAVRNTLSPAFTGSKLKQMTPLISECCDQLVTHLHQLRKTETDIQCQSLYGAYSMDVIATAFFGMQVDSQKNPDDPFVKYAKEGFNFNMFSLKFILVYTVPNMGKLYKLLGKRVTNSVVGDFFQDVVSRSMELRKTEDNKVFHAALDIQDVVSRSMELRKTEDNKRRDMLQLMIDAHKLDRTNEEGEKDALIKGHVPGDESSQTKTALTADEITSNAFIFFLAGYETTNTALCMTSYLLAINRDHQEKLIQEVDKIAPRKEDITYEVVGQMEYLDGVVRESLRIYPPAASTDRINNKKDITLKGYSIPKGFSILVPIYAIHHDPEIWENPEEFRPERFFKENRANIHPCSWLPFGDGPRSCIGMRLALMEIKFALVTILQEFKFETCSETEIPPRLNSQNEFLSPRNGVKLEFVPRKKTQ